MSSGGSIQRWVSCRLSDARWAIRRRWRRARGHHGAFANGEVSARAAQLTTTWQDRWQGVEPIGYLLREAYADRWVRFHSLPQSKRYAETAAEYDEILRRHRTVLRDLQGSVPIADLYVIATDWDWRDLAAGWSKHRLPGAWPWWSSRGDEDTNGRHYFWVATGLSDAALDGVLLAAADDEGQVLIGAPGFAWLYCPYDGGADVLLPDQVERDALKARYSDWLSSHPGGL